MGTTCVRPLERLSEDVSRNERNEAALQTEQHKETLDKKPKELVMNYPKFPFHLGMCAV